MHIKWEKVSNRDFCFANWISGLQQGVLGKETGFEIAQTWVQAPAPPLISLLVWSLAKITTLRLSFCIWKMEIIISTVITVKIKWANVYSTPVTWEALSQCHQFINSHLLGSKPPRSVGRRKWGNSQTHPGVGDGSQEQTVLPLMTHHWAMSGKGTVFSFHWIISKSFYRPLFCKKAIFNVLIISGVCSEACLPPLCISSLM